MKNRNSYKCLNFSELPQNESRRTLYFSCICRRKILKYRAKARILTSKIWRWHKWLSTHDTLNKTIHHVLDASRENEKKHLQRITSMSWWMRDAFIKNISISDNVLSQTHMVCSMPYFLGCLSIHSLHTYMQIDLCNKKFRQRNTIQTVTKSH